jgi:D-alanyl-D-alanine dipeptidase
MTCVLIAILGNCAQEQRRSAAQMRQAVNLAGRHGLVDVRATVPGVRIDLKYGTAENLTGQPLYPRHMPCLLRASTAERLRQAQITLAAQGYRLRLWDAWRPPEVQERLHRHAGSTGLFLSPGTGWSRHCGGVSLDATLEDAQGKELRMPTAFDDNLPGAASRADHPDPEIRRNLSVLHQAMRDAGLIPLPGEWWHFDDIDHLHDPVPVIWGRDLGLFP